MKKFLSLILLLTTTTMACAQGAVEFWLDSNHAICFTSDTSRMLRQDAQASSWGLLIAGQGLWTGDYLGQPGSIAALPSQPTFIAALYGGPNAGSLTLQTTTTIGDSFTEGNVSPVLCFPAGIPAGTVWTWQVQVYSGINPALGSPISSGAQAAWDAGHYAGASSTFRATLGVVPVEIGDPTPFTQGGAGSTWAAGTAELTDWPVAQGGPYGAIEVMAVAVPEAQFTYTTNNGTITITGYAGSGGDVTIPDIISGLAVTSIGDRAFYGWTNLASFTIPSGVTNIGSYAFEYCTSLTGVYFEGDAPSLGSFVFDYDHNATVYYLPGTTGWGTTFGGLPTVLLNYTYTTANGAITITGYTGPGGPVTIPSFIHGLPVTSIGQRAFYSCTGLTSVTIGNSVTNIGDYAFVNCGLTSVTIPASVTTIGKGPFGFCTKLTAITVDTNNPAYGSVDGVLFNKSQATLIQCPGGKAGSYAVPNSVTSIADWAFFGCPSLRNVMIPNSVTNFGQGAFEYCGLTRLMIPNSITSIGTETFCECRSLTNVMIPNSVTTIGQEAFYYCTSLTSVTIPASVTSLGILALANCGNLRELYFEGNAPSTGPLYLNATVYYLPGTTGWSTTFGGCSTALWVQVPTIQTPPQTQTAEAGSAVGLGVDASSPLPLFYFWYLNDTNLICWSTNCDLKLTNVQFSQTDTYTVVVSNMLGAVTSGPAMLNVIAPVERRPVPGIKVTGQTGSVLNLDYADFLRPAPKWTTVGSVSLISTSQYWFDLTLPLPPQRFFQAWQTGTPGVIPSLDLHRVPAITVAGNVGSSVRVDAINQFGPTDAWFTLDTVTLTNASQLYFDTSVVGQPARLWRLVPVP